MRIAAAASAFPQHYYPQTDLLNGLRQYWGDKLADVRLLDRLHEHVGVDGRYLALPMESYLDLDTWGKANDAWMTAALETGQKAICRALTRADVAPKHLGALFFISISGIASPSIDARLINRMGLSPSIRQVPIFGLGCVGGAAGISLAADYVRAYPDRTAVVLAVEFCSLTLQRDDVSVANLISSGLFGDGAAAVIVSGDQVERPGPEILATRSIFYPDTEQVMGWDISEKGFRIVLSREVPAMVRKHLAPDVDEFLKDNGLARGDVGIWIMHTGGPAVLEATEKAFDLRNGELRVSWDCLRKTGNLSSASVLVVLGRSDDQRQTGAEHLQHPRGNGPGFLLRIGFASLVTSLSADFDTDVFVTGGGPAGLAVAIAARRTGLRVSLADASVPPIDKACGEGLMPDAQLALRKLGIDLDPSDGFPFRGIRFLDGAISVAASFPDGGGIGMRRTALHRKMVEHAAALGVDLLWGCRVTGIDGDRVQVRGTAMRARWIVGADGAGSPVRRWSGLDSNFTTQWRFGFRVHYRLAPWTDCMEIYWGSGCQIYVTPVGPEDLCVALISRDKHLRLDEALDRFPEVRARLSGARRSTMERGAVSATRRLKSVYRGRIALAGDASGSVDAITGEGICLGFQQALALADALANGDLAHYQAEHKRILRRPAFMAHTMLLMENRTRLRRRALGALSSSPPIFAGMLAMHVGAASPFEFAANGIELGWRMLVGLSG